MNQNVAEELQMGLFGGDALAVEVPKKRHLYMVPAPSRLTILSFGGGQDSTTLLYKLALDPEFRAQWAPHDLLVVMSNTGDEHPLTYEHITFVKGFCEKHGIEFVFLTTDMGYHAENWQSLRGFYRLKGTIGSRAYVKSCTDQLKLQPIYRFLSEWVSKRYSLSSKGKQMFTEFHERYGKINMLIGIAAGEESRCAMTPEEEETRFSQKVATISHILRANLRIPEETKPARKMIKDFEDKIKVITPVEAYVKEAKKVASKLFPLSPAWRRLAIRTVYPLIPLGLDRKGCQEYMRSTGLPVPPPSNCICCPFLGEVEIIWLYRNLRADWDDWVALEQAKIDKHQHMGSKNLGVCGKKLLPQVLEEALAKYGHMTDEEIADYKFSHGHCVLSTY